MKQKITLEADMLRSLMDRLAKAEALVGGPAAVSAAKPARALTFKSFDPNVPKGMKQAGIPADASAFARAVAVGSGPVSAYGPHAAHSVSALTFVDVGEGIASVKPAALAAWRAFRAALG